MILGTSPRPTATSFWIKNPGGRADVLIQRRQNQNTQYTFHPATALRAENVTSIVGLALSHAS
jgi:hypothetical protein